MNKVVINQRYGGFSLSLKAARMLFAQLPQEHPGRDKLAASIEFAESYELRSLLASVHISSNLPRHDENLIRVVEDLGDEANGSYAKLVIVEIPGNKYRVDEYDGWESIDYPENDGQWVVIDD